MLLSREYSSKVIRATVDRARQIARLKALLNKDEHFNTSLSVLNQKSVRVIKTLDHLLGAFTYGRRKCYMHVTWYDTYVVKVSQ